MKLIVPIAITAMALSGCIPHMNFSGERYRIRGAQYAQLGLIGAKRSYGVSDFEPYSRPDLSTVPFPLVNQQYQKKEKDGELLTKLKASYPQTGGSGEIQRIQQSLESGNYLVFTVLERDKLVDALNNDPSALAALKRKNARIITTVVVVFDHNQHDVRNLKSSASGSITANIVGGSSNPSLTLNGQGNWRQDIRIADGYNICYEFSRPIFDKTGQLVDVQTDKIGWFDRIF